MIPIGGYYSLEINEGQELHGQALRLNAGRYALEYILKARKYRKVFIPYFICESILHPIKRLGVDMITAITRYCVGDSVPTIEQRPYDGHWAEVVIHAPKDGIFESMEISDSLKAEVVERDLWVKPGDKVNAFLGANDSLGTLVLKFQTADELEYAITHQREWLKVVVKS